MSVQSRQLGVPRPTGPRVQRVALLRRLESAAEPLILVVAPSGFGKTSLLAEWAATTDVQVCWLSCDESDGEPGAVLVPAHFLPGCAVARHGQ